MIFNNIQGDWTLDIPAEDKNVAIKISGGADSAIVTYMLAVYKRDERPDIKLIPITTNALPPKDWQVKYSKRVLNKVTELTGVEFESHITNEVTKDGEEYFAPYDKTFNTYISTQYALDVESRDLYDVKFDGVTKNPPDIKGFYFYKGSEDPDRSDGNEWSITTKFEHHYMPMRVYDKKGVCDFYVQNNVLDSLFPVTRSCENDGAYMSIDHERHCEQCWFCRERYWGFGRYI